MYYLKVSLPTLILQKIKLTDQSLPDIIEHGDKGTGSYAMAAHTILQLYTKLSIINILATAFSSN